MVRDGGDEVKDDDGSFRAQHCRTALVQRPIRI
jgi:hypothetical protein